VWILPRIIDETHDNTADIINKLQEKHAKAELKILP